MLSFCNQALKKRNQAYHETQKLFQCVTWLPALFSTINIKRDNSLLMEERERTERAKEAGDLFLSMGCSAADIWNHWK